METIYTRLRTWRWQQALALNVPSFFILSNAHLAAIALACPDSMEALAGCAGMGPKKLAQFGEHLLAVLRQAVADGLEPGVVPPPQPEERPLTEDEVHEIAVSLRQELARTVARRLKGRYTPAQVEEALRRIAVTA